MNKIKILILLLLVQLFLVFPASVKAQSFVDAFKEPLVQCGLTTEVGQVGGPCTLNDALKLLNRVMNLGFAVGFAMLSVIIFWLGFSYIYHYNSDGDIKKIREKIKIVFYGIVFMFCAWLIVYTFEKTFLKDYYKSKSFLIESEK